MDWLQSKYVGLLSVRLRNYRQRGASFNFSCPICGDSEKNKSKARGYIYEYKGDLKYHCHNCGADMPMEQFLKEIDPGLYNEYSLEKIRERRQGSAKFEDVAPKKYSVGDAMDELKCLRKLPITHPCRKFVTDRLIPDHYLDKLFFVPKFKQWCNQIIPDKFEDTSNDHPRLLIPFFDKHRRMHAFQGRALEDTDNRTRYIMIVTDESIPSLYGLDTVNLNKRTYAFEGPIDSMFFPNSIASGGGDFHTRLVGIDHSNVVLVYDNEPYSIYTKRKLKKAIMAGFTVCLWPDNIEHKDVNDMILAGLETDYIKYAIDNNLHSGLMAEMAISKWSKC